MGRFDAANGVPECKPRSRPAARPFKGRDSSTAAPAEIQTEIFNNALPCLKPGGRIVYSTCSIEDAENTDLVKAFAETQGLKLGKTVRILPTEHGTDGAFAAVLRGKG